MGTGLSSRVTIAALFSLSLLTLLGCSSPVDTLLSINVAPNGVLLLSGGMQPLGVNASYTSGAVKQVANWTYTSSNPAVAVINADGYIQAVAAGSTNLTVVYKENGVSKSVTIPVKVEPAPTHAAVYYVSE